MATPKQQIDEQLKIAQAALDAAAKIANDHMIVFSWSSMLGSTQYYPDGYRPQNEDEEYLMEEYGRLQGWISSSEFC